MLFVWFVIYYRGVIVKRKITIMRTKGKTATIRGGGDQKYVVFNIRFEYTYVENVLSSILARSWREGVRFPMVAVETRDSGEHKSGVHDPCSTGRMNGPLTGRVGVRRSRETVGGRTHALGRGTTARRSYDTVFCRVVLSALRRRRTRTVPTWRCPGRADGL